MQVTISIQAVDGPGVVAALEQWIADPKNASRLADAVGRVAQREARTAYG